ncbi:MAG: hypothetical protein SGJ09_00305 [Phycisphaerae bacterium]|nr:hypothetical protein [Phycisphaerae bacterium]
MPTRMCLTALSSAVSVALVLTSPQLVSEANASSLVVTSATASISIGTGCSDTCSPPIDTTCFISCESASRTISEFAGVTLSYNAIAIESSATADAFSTVPREVPSAIAEYSVEFTVDGPTFIYATWNIFFPPADNDFLPRILPPEGVWVGEIPGGAHTISAALFVSGGDTLSTGLLIRVIPDPTADCDNDGTPDWQEIIEGTQTDLNNDGIPDECPMPNPADLNGDGVVGPPDLGILLGSWGECVGCPADFTGDGLVTPADLGILLGAWG